MAQADAKRLPPAIFNCTTSVAAASLKPAAPSPATEVARGEQDAPSLLDAGLDSRQGSQSGGGVSAQQKSSADAGGRPQEFSFATRVSNSLKAGQANDLAAP